MNFPYICLYLGVHLWEAMVSMRSGARDVRAATSVTTCQRGEVTTLSDDTFRQVR